MNKLGIQSLNAGAPDLRLTGSPETYTQRRRRQMAAGGGIMGSNNGSMLVAPTADGSRPGYGWLSDIKDKFVDDIIPNEIKENPMAAAALLGVGSNYLDILPGDMDSTGWINNLLGGGSNVINEALQKDLSGITGTGLGPDDANWQEILRKQGSNIPSNIYTDAILRGVTGSTYESPGIIGAATNWVRDQFGNLVNKVTGQTQTAGDTTGQNINWKGPLAIGTAVGAADYLTRSDDKMPEQLGLDTSRFATAEAAKADPNLRFKPQEAYTLKDGGRIGYAGGGILNILRRLMTPEAKRFKKFNYSQGITDDYKMDITEIMEEMSEKIYGKSYSNLNKKQQMKIFDAANEERANIQSLIPEPDDFAQGGRIGYKNAGDVEIPEVDTENILKKLLEFRKKREGYEDAIFRSERIDAQEGGLMNLGGMEKDYRQEGGFVPIGGQEKADDVPARLSKNEFVFTADAVRAAGGGDIDAGAQVMENLMENLEAGGKVSEESQGLEGAQEMFANTQRLQNRII